MKTRSMLWTLAMLSLAAAGLASCGNWPIVLTATPVAEATLAPSTMPLPTEILTPTATFTPTPTPTLTATTTPTPILTLTPTMTPTPTVSPIAWPTLTPQAEINMKDVGALLLSQTSHRFEIEVASPISEALHVSGTFHYVCTSCMSRTLSRAPSWSGVAPERNWSCSHTKRLC